MTVRQAILTLARLIEARERRDAASGVDPAHAKWAEEAGEIVREMEMKQVFEQMDD